MVPTLAVISIVVFILIQLPPGDIVSANLAALQQQGMEVSTEQIEALRQQYDLDKPLPLQYLNWIFNFVQGDMGVFSPLDAGLFLQTLLLSAQANGLGTIAQGALAMWGSPVRAEFPEVPVGWKLLCGVSLGYATEEKVNTFNPGRRQPRGSFGFAEE